MVDQETLEQNQFVLSYELLHLLQWLMEHEEQGLKKLISKAVKKGFKKELNHLETTQNIERADHLQQAIPDFLTILEALLIETMHEDSMKQVLEQNLMPTIDHIDTTICDDATVARSIAKATDKLEDNPQVNFKEVLFKEILRQWKPSKKNSN